MTPNLVTAWMGDCNVTLAGIPSHLLSRLQSVMNAAACFVFSWSRFDRITPLLLHQLKALERIAFKCAVLVYSCLYGSAPSYLIDELYQLPPIDTVVEARQRLCSASSLLVLCEYSKFRIESNTYFSIRFDSKRAQLFQIFEYVLSPISYLFNRMMPIFHVSNQQHQQTLWPTKYWNSYNRNHNSLE